MDRYDEQAAETIGRWTVMLPRSSNAYRMLHAHVASLRDHIASALRAAATVQEGCGTGLIAAERQRQISAEGYTYDHDDDHDTGDIAAAASVYAMPPDIRNLADVADIVTEYVWPRGWLYKETPTDRIRELVKAGALIAAEIDRLTRAAAEAASKAQPRVITIEDAKPTTENMARAMGQVDEKAVQDG